MGHNGDSEFGIQDKQCRKIARKLWAEKYPRNIIWDLLDGILCETKWNNYEDIQYTTYDNFINTTYVVVVPSIVNDW